MPIVPAIQVRAAAKAITWGPIRDAIAGAASYLVRHKNSLPEEPALEVWSDHASGTAPVLWARASEHGQKVLEVRQSGVVLTSPDGATSLAITNGGVVSVGQPAGLQVYNVLDYGLVRGLVETNAAPNTSALQTLWATVIENGGGTVYFPPGGWALAPTILSHLGDYGACVSLLGSDGAATLMFYGATGPFLDIAPTSAGALSRCGIRDLTIMHAQTPTGATIALGYCTNYVIDNLRVVSQLANGALTAIRIGTGATNVQILNSKLETFTAGPGNPATIDVQNGPPPSGIPAGGLVIMNTDISGYYGRSAGIRFANTALWDTVWLGPGTLIKDHQTGIIKTIGAGDVENVIASDVAFDGCSAACIQLEPSAGEVRNWAFTGCWFAGDAYNVIANEAGGGLIDRLSFSHCYFTNATVNAFAIGAGVANLTIEGCHVNTGVGAGGNGVEISGAGISNVLLQNTTIIVPAAANASYFIGAGVTSGVCTGNLSRGKAGSAPATTAAWIHDHNAFLA
jgi:hypothetical protein